MAIRGLIFDFDGLIVDSEGPDHQSWQECFAEHGCELPAGLWADLIGRAVGVVDLYALMEEQLGRPLDRAAVRAARRRRYLELMAAQPVLPGVEAYLRAARGLGLRRGVASSGTREWVVGNLERLGLHAHFECVRCREDVTHAKPEPELYLAALDALELRPHEAIAFEDSPNGVLAAKRAGLYCVAVPNPLTADMPLDHADLRLPSLAHLPLPDLLRRIEVE